MKEKLLVKLPKGAKLTDTSTWLTLLEELENVEDCPYLLWCIYETLRRDSSATISSAVKLTETTQIHDKIIRDDHDILIGIHRLHMNPDQWTDPLKFNPERFNPESPYYLAKDNKKRHPLSFGPFLGGKRICLGKTFAEYVPRCILPIILAQLNFEIPEDSDIFPEEKPSFSHFSNYSYYKVRVSQINEKDLLE